jgi:uncharacterized membrane protein YraQ (UPF0718 family)
MTAIAATLERLWSFKPDRAWLVSLSIVALVALLDAPQTVPAITFTLDALLSTAPYIAFAIFSVAYLKATGAEVIMARAFEGRETQMIVYAALFGGLAPFCSCEVIPFVAGLLALGTPLSAVMAFWLSSPLIDPPSLLITASALGWPFAVAKAVAAVAMGLMGGFAVKSAISAGWFANPLQSQVPAASCCGSQPATTVRSDSHCSSTPAASVGCGASSIVRTDKPVWRFWQHGDRRTLFGEQFIENTLFLLKWLTLAYLLESLMVTYVPAEMIAGLVGGSGLTPIVLSALVGAPAYLNSYVAPPLVAGLMEQGMSAGGAMAFMVAGAVSCIPAMTAVFALVKRTVFAAYVALGFTGAVASGVIYGLLVNFAVLP